MSGTPLSRGKTPEDDARDTHLIIELIRAGYGTKKIAAKLEISDGRVRRLARLARMKLPPRSKPGLHKRPRFDALEEQAGKPLREVFLDARHRRISMRQLAEELGVTYTSLRNHRLKYDLPPLPMPKPVRDPEQLRAAQLKSMENREYPKHSAHGLTHTIAEWSQIIGITPSSVRRRLLKCPPESALPDYTKWPEDQRKKLADSVDFPLALANIES